MVEKRIIIVDDDKQLLKSLRSLLSSEGYHVEVAENGKEAIRKAKNKFYNLALLDIRLPDMKGTKLLIDMDGNYPKMKKIVVTGYPDLDNAVESLNLGADAYIIKPVKPNELLELVAEKLKEQEKAEKMAEEKVEKWIKTRAKKFEEKQEKKERENEKNHQSNTSK